MTKREAIEILERYDDLVWQSEHHITMSNIADALQTLINAVDDSRPIDEEKLDKLAKKEFGCYTLDEQGNHVYQDNDDISEEDLKSIRNYKAGYRKAIEE